MRKLQYIMVKSYLLFALFICTALLFGCANDTSSLDEMRPSVPLEVLGVKTEQSNNSRAIITSSTLTSGSIGVCLTKSSGSYSNYDSQNYSNVQYTLNGSGASNANGIKLSSTSGYLYAYYPYSSSVTNLNNIPIAVGGETDYMYATAKSNVNDHNASHSFLMNHAMARIQVVIKRGESYTGTGTVTSVKVTSNAFRTSGSLNAYTGATTTISSGSNSYTQTNSKTIASGSTSTQTWEYLVLPYQTSDSSISHSTNGASATFTFNVVIDSKSYSFTSSATAVKTGYTTTFTLTIGATTGSAAITPGGTVDWVQLWSGGPKWAVKNIGATDVTDYGNYYGWGGFDEKTNKTNADYNATTATSYTLTGSEDTAFNKWGSKWRMPTKDDFDKLFAKCTWSWQTSYKGIPIKGYLVTGTETGYTENSVFFPAAGYYSATTKVFVDKYADYWSSISAANKTAYRMFFSAPSYQGTQPNEVSAWNRASGFTIRPVLNE